MAFQPVPTYADPVEVNPKTGKHAFNPTWLSWFLAISNGSLAKALAHNSLTGLQGGQANQYYHMTAAQAAAAYYKNNGAQSAITPTGSPFTYTNADTFEEDVVCMGGTVSSVLWSRDAFATSVSIPTAGIIRLAVGDAIRVTYTGAPTLTKIPR